jgi:steroid 5-alpha reductase family enzyme
VSASLSGIGIDLASNGQLYLLCVAWTFLAITLLWAIGLLQGNHSMVDGYYGFGYAIPVWIAYAATGAASATAAVLLVLTSLHGCRLGCYLSKRWWGYRKTLGGDRRYLDFAQKYARGYWWKSFLIIMEPQALIIALIGLPAVWGILATRSASGPLNALSLFGVLVFAIGFYFETVADGQLQAFKADPRNHGRYLRTGAWTWSRHPNYFGNITVWWGLWLIAVAGAPSIWWTALAPILNTLMLTTLFGRALQDRLLGVRPEYQALMRKTRALLPLPPAGARPPPR